MLDRIRNLDIDRIDLEEAVELAAYGRLLRLEFEQNGVEIPEWLDNRMREIRREIKARQADNIEKRLREAKARMETLKPAEQRRVELQAEIEKLESMLQQ